MIPDLSNPQSWNRYSYVLNNPIRFNDPSGHCIWDLCIVEGIGVVELVLAASTIYAGTLALNNHDAIAKSITNAFDDWQINKQNKKQLASIETSSYNSGDNYLGPGHGYKPPSKCGWACFLTILGAGSYLGYRLYCSADDEKCAVPTAKSTPESTPTSTIPSTSTPSPDQALKITLTSAPTSTLTSTLTSTSTSTPSNTPTTTSTPTLPPIPLMPPIEPRRYHGHYEY